ncbi:MAG: InlB B-repeat-containing protein [Sulfuricurvum sp.]|uniref:InlB B-repeat-containing protein n=1 Tax=Sulfuricurvum sp. TaxID=2025608 RepID=UPI00262D2945|nr:InlB B-repeat-containing protein [Sulfuricurvum sp.]MDD2828275.1 InlB B-repeat-containing protein [Sulfuricurvum sp.]MDD4949770.1 InlB B-repeat-containing protein [Sulfuricurvum sp.]
MKTEIFPVIASEAWQSKLPPSSDTTRNPLIDFILRALMVIALLMAFSSESMAATYKVTYNKNSATSGTVPTDTTNYASGATVTVKDNTGSLVRTNYIFAGWNTNSSGTGTTYAAGDTFSMPAANTTLYAKWTPVYKVTYNKNSATSGTVPTDTTNYASGATVTVKDNTGSLVRTNYIFAGWNTNSSGTGTTYAAGDTFSMPAANTTLYAKWTPVYKVTYNSNSATSGTVPTDASSPYLSGTDVTVLDNTGSLVRTNYIFAGWNTNSSGTGTTYTAGQTFPITANTTLYAKWIRVYSVTYNSNNGYGTITDSNSPYTSGSSVTVMSDSGFTRTNYVFTNWNTAADGSGTSYAVGDTFNIATNITLYAQWTSKQNPPGITVQNQTATVGIAFSIDLDDFVTLTDGDPITAITLIGTLPDGLTYNTATHVISGTPTNAAVGISTMSVTATDKDGTSALPNGFLITVTQPSPPTGSVPDQYLSLNASMTALDLDNYFTSNSGAITFPSAISGLPTGLSYSSSTHQITGTPTTTGTWSITITVSNNKGSISDTFTITVWNSSANLRDFTLQRQDNIYGDMQIIGNSIMLDSSTADGCADFTTPNNDISAIFADKDYDKTTFNSTSANLKLPKGVDSTRIQYAYLYWQGRTHNKNTVPLGRTMKLKTYGDAGYTTVESNASKFNWNGSGDYQGTADVTDQIKRSIDQVPLATINSSGYDQPVWGADVYSTITSGNNDFGAWSLVVVYKENTNINTTAKFRSITLFDGYLEVFSSDNSFSLNGFLTPKTGLVDAKFLMFGGEGDISYSDGLTLTNSAGTEISLPNAPATPSGTTSVWGSSEDINGVNVGNRYPSCQNTIGIDMRTFSIGTSSTTSIIGNDQTSTTITLKGTGNDQYFPGVFAFSTELYMPQLCYDYSLKQDGRFLNLDRSNPLPHITQGISSSPLELTVYLKNKEADIIAQDISMKADLNASRFDYTMSDKMYVSNINGSAFIDRGVPADNSPENCTYQTASGNTLSSQGCVAYLDNNLLTTDDDQRRVRKGIGSLGSEQYIYNQFTLMPKAIGGAIGDINESLGLTIDYQITAGGVTMPYTDYVLGSATVPICTQVSSYTPTWGLFNVVQNGLKTNNLTTQISRKPFDVDVIYDSTIATGDNAAPTVNVNTTVQVEMIDVDAFADVNASCANPGASVSEPVYVPIAFTPAKYQTKVASQDSSYYNFALKNGAYRVWYFTDSNGTLRTWNAAGLSNANKSITGISGLFNSASHGECNTSCIGHDTTAGYEGACFECMKQNYAKPLCSRDNFSVRPEAFDIRIKDYNTAGTVTTDLTHDVYKYAPDTTPTTRMNLAAGYDYKYDINATGYENNTSGLIGVPRYTREFKGANTDYNATMLWDSALTTTTCNDIAARNLTFYIANGSLSNQANHQDQVGDYLLNMIDKSWTAVDQVNHTNANGFLAGTDCRLNVNDTVKDGSGQYGCEISTAHTNTPLLYKDQSLTFKPAKFDLNTTTYGLGMNFSPLVANKGFVYMSDLNKSSDMNMSVRAKGQIKALGDNNATLSNFVSGCFARDINVSVSTDANLTYATPFNARMITTNLAETNTVADTNKTNMNVWNGAITQSSFLKDGNGSLMNTLRFNFDRNQTTTQNPQTVHYTDINVSCLNASDCNQSSMRNSIVANTAAGTAAMDFNVTHVYGRVAPIDVHVIGGLVAFDAIAHYEVYNTATLLDTPLAADTSATGASWFINALHSEAKDGNASVTVVVPAGASSLPTAASYYDNNGTEHYKFGIFTIRQGYTAHIDTESWLWNGTFAKTYSDPDVNNNVDCLTHPCFNISYGRIIGNTGSAKTESEAQKQNKNTKSGTGWQSSSEYAPSTR